jgi:hypothetical protein
MVTVKPVFEFITTAKRNQAIGLLVIGATMLVCSNIAESEIASGFGLEAVQFLVILFGITATAMVFRNGRLRGGKKDE